MVESICIKTPAPCLTGALGAVPKGTCDIGWIVEMLTASCMQVNTGTVDCLPAG